MTAKYARHPLTEAQKIRRGERGAKWIAEHPDIKSYRNARYEKNKDSLLERQKTYKASLPPGELFARRKRYSAAYEEKRVSNYQKDRHTRPWLNSLRGAKTRAKRDKLPFLLTAEWAEAKWTGRCEITGLAFSMNIRRSPHVYSPSLDKIVPALGYTPENCRFILHGVNAMKATGTDEQMLEVAKAIVAGLSPS